MTTKGYTPIKEITPARRVRSVHAALRKLNTAWDLYDTTLMLCCVRVFVKYQYEDMGIPKNVALVLAHRMLADSLCARYGCYFAWPNAVHHLGRGSKRSMVWLPTLDNIQIGERKRRTSNG